MYIKYVNYLLKENRKTNKHTEKMGRILITLPSVKYIKKLDS